ncbi:MAG: MaoC domain protein dehydratase [Polaromonas sp.]|nr:MaoC domain protein dehydratase [Polaromonas sp.]
MMFSNFEAIQVGERRSLTKTITEADVRRFVEMTGDDNPLHVDADYARGTPFKDVVVHGMLGASFISTVIGTRLPGPGALWVSQQMEFLLPVRLGDALTVSCEVLKKHEGERLLELETVIVNQHGQRVLTGRGKVKLLAEPAGKAAFGPEKRMVALVTGGAGGIGEAICERLASDGFAVVVNYANRSQPAASVVARIVASGGRAVAVQADVASEAGVAKLYEATVNEFGGVGVLVNNASLHVNAKPFASAAWADVQQHLDVQAKASFLLAQRCAPGMAADKWGRIVNITSQVTRALPTPGWLGYTLAKTALAALTRSMAVELGPQGITVNAVAPGMTDTRLIGSIPEKVQLMTARQTPMRRLAVPQDVTDAVAWLVSDAGAFITGQELHVNGGMVM